MIKKGESTRKEGKVVKWLVLVVVISIIMIKAAEVLDRYARKNYIPLEEMMQRYAQPDKYVPWSYEKRMRYYDREVRLHRRPIPSKRVYKSSVETGYVRSLSEP